jgi:signal transduction histidine kinase
MEWLLKSVARGTAVAGLPARHPSRDIALATALGLIYFLAAQLSQGLTLADGVAVFWPAAGLSSGMLIALGSAARLPVAAAVSMATIAVHILRADPLWAGAALGLCNAAEALIIAGLIDRFFGAGFRLNRLPHVLGLLLAAVAGTAISGIGGALTYRLFQGPSAPILATWQHWFASDAVGVIAGAPLVIGLVGLAREPPPRTEFVEGVFALAVLSVMTAAIILLPQEPWQTVGPLALLFPILLWLAARCQPALAAAGAFIVSFIFVLTTIDGVGHFGDPNIPVGDRILDAQVAILFVTLGALILAALFAERRQNETHLARMVVMLERERTNKMMSIKAATSSIVHEVRQPLTGITAKSSAARRWLKRDPPDVEKVAQLLHEIEGAGFRADEVLENVRRLFQDADHEREMIDVNGMARDAVQTLADELNHHHVRTILDLTSELPNVMGHRTQLQEVIVNLVNNAIDAMAPVKARRRVLRVGTKLNGGKKIIIEVEDSGHGIKPERIDGIFEAFVTTKPKGTGLGLAICMRIIEGHGGQLTASSDGKSGALFQIMLPIESTVASAGLSKEAHHADHAALTSGIGKPPPILNVRSISPIPRKAGHAPPL